MWEWWCLGNQKEKKTDLHHHHHHNQALLILRRDDGDDDDSDYLDPDPTATIASAAMVLTSWLRHRRRRYLLLLALFSPLLLPFLCATFPLLCAVEVCLRLCRLRRRRRLRRIRQIDDRRGDGLSRCEEGRGQIEGGEVRLLQRYLEDQLDLVIGSVYDCGGGDDGDDCSDELLGDCDGVEFFESRSNPLLH